MNEDECVHEFDPDEGFTCINCGQEGLGHILAKADHDKD